MCRWRGCSRPTRRSPAKRSHASPARRPTRRRSTARRIPGHPWDPAGPALSANIPLMIGYARTEETLYDRPTPETLALDEAGLKLRAAKRLGEDPERVIEAFRKAHPDATPWDLWILIATDHPRGTYAREPAKRKAAQAAAPAFLYRFDWETPEGGGHMRSPHTIEIPVRLQQHQDRGSAHLEDARRVRSWRRKRARPGSRSRARAIRTCRVFRSGRRTRRHHATRCCSTTPAASSRIPIADRVWRWSRC